jgi:hypothetical protein
MASLHVTSTLSGLSRLTTDDADHFCRRCSISQLSVTGSIVILSGVALPRHLRNSHARRANFTAPTSTTHFHSVTVGVIYRSLAHDVTGCSYDRATVVSRGDGDPSHKELAAGYTLRAAFAGM